FTDTPPTELAALTLHDALPIFRDGGVLRQGEIDDEFGPVGGGKELVLDEAHGPDRHRKGRKREHDRCPAEAHRKPEHTVERAPQDRKSTRLNSSHVKISYAVFC